MGLIGNNIKLILRLCLKPKDNISIENREQYNNKGLHLFLILCFLAYGIVFAFTQTTVVLTPLNIVTIIVIKLVHIFLYFYVFTILMYLIGMPCKDKGITIKGLYSSYLPYYSFSTILFCIANVVKYYKLLIPYIIIIVLCNLWLCYLSIYSLSILYGCNNRLYRVKGIVISCIFLLLVTSSVVYLNGNIMEPDLSRRPRIGFEVYKHPIEVYNEVTNSMVQGTKIDESKSVFTIDSKNRNQIKAVEFDLTNNLIKMINTLDEYQRVQAAGDTTQMQIQLENFNKEKEDTRIIIEYYKSGSNK